MSRVLLFESDPDLAVIIGRVLGRRGHNLVHVTDGPTGLREADAERPDLVILDAALPDIHRERMLERLRQLSDAPVLMLTSLSRVPAGLDSSADAYLAKPFRATELVELVETLLQQRSAEPAARVVRAGQGASREENGSGAATGDGRRRAAGAPDYAPVAASVAAEVTVAVYLDTEEESVAGRIFRAVDAVGALLGLEVTAEELQRGSFFRRVWAVFRRGLTAEEVASRLIKVERAIELAHLDARQADVDQKEASAIAELFGSLTDVPQACLRIGSIFIVKYPGDGGPVLLCRNLSQLELRALERYPEIQRDPRRALDSLATALSTFERDDAVT